MSATITPDGIVVRDIRWRGTEGAAVFVTTLCSISIARGITGEVSYGSGLSTTAARGMLVSRVS